MDYIHGINVGNVTYGLGLPNFYINDKGNLNIETSTSIGNTPANKGKINIEANSDILFKPGDDIILYSHHRAEGKQNEVAIKMTDGDDNPVKTQINTSEINLTTKLKDGNDGGDMNIEVNCNTDTRGYLKVRAQAIDLRCEKHGGIALQPKGYDGDGNMNKIKFEHGGGDGLEFGTFNSEKTSIFTDEYRFNKDGVWKMSTRLTEASGKTIKSEGTIPSGKVATGSLKYKKNTSANNAALATLTEKTYEAPDDFYDFIDTKDAQCTTEDIIKTASALNGGLIETKRSDKGNVKIASQNDYLISEVSGTPTEATKTFSVPENVDLLNAFTKDELKQFVSGETKLNSFVLSDTTFKLSGHDDLLFVIEENTAPKISIESENEVGLDAKYGDVVITSGDCIKMEAPEIRLNALNADKSGGTVNFGATQNVWFIGKKLTNGLKVEAPTTPTRIKQLFLNNSQDVAYWTGTMFFLVLKELYGKNNSDELVKITPSNYNDYKETTAYFSDGSVVPADYTCYCGFTTEDDGTYTTNIYAMGTKGSSSLFKKNLGKKVATYTHSSESALGSTRTVAANDSDEDYAFVDGMEYLGFIFDSEESSISNDQYITTVQPGDFVEGASIKLDDMFTLVNKLTDITTLVNYFKTGDGQADGPWAPQL